MNGQRVFRRLTVNELSAWLAQHPDALLLDTRDAASHARDGWPGSLRLSRDNQDDLLLRLSRRRPILIYCYHGNASRTWASMFADFGFTEVCDLIGGHAAWAANARAASPASAPVDAAPAGRPDRQGFAGLEETAARTRGDPAP